MPEPRVTVIQFSHADVLAALRQAGERERPYFRAGGQLLRDPQPAIVTHPQPEKR